MIICPFILIIFHFYVFTFLIKSLFHVKTYLLMLIYQNLHVLPQQYLMLKIKAFLKLIILLGINYCNEMSHIIIQSMNFYEDLKKLVGEATLNFFWLFFNCFGYCLRLFSFNLNLIFQLNFIVFFVIIFLSFFDLFIFVFIISIYLFILI